MNNDKNETGQTQTGSNQDENNNQQPLPVHNPLNPDDHREITQEDIDNEQKYKEALSERD